MDVVQIALWVLIGLFALLCGGAYLFSMLILGNRRRATEVALLQRSFHAVVGALPGKVTVRTAADSRVSLVDDLSSDAWDPNQPPGWVEALDRLPPGLRADVAQLLSHAEGMDGPIPVPADRLRAALREFRMIEASLARDGFRGRYRNHLDEAPSPLSPEERSEVAGTSGTSIDHALAMLFIRLGPPPEETELDYAPASNGGGGAQQ
ncbi:hypothetical protein [Streptomyces sp. NPDC058548]|uniref:hypothetical protein n=1 Tax=Streptomyces sp. NPDC058548 TaxID=3346545 RepID=UPI0036507A62